MRGVFVYFVAVAKLRVLAHLYLYTWFIYNTLYICLKLAGSSHILTKFMDAQRHTALFFSLMTWAVRRVCVTGVLAGIISIIISDSFSPNTKLNI